MSRTDRLIGIAIGLVIGVVAVILFVFGGGADEIDDPSLEGGANGAIHWVAPPAAAGAAR